MYPMSLYESGDSSGVASLQAMFDGTQKNVNVGKQSLQNLANLIVRGGWPDNIDVDPENITVLPKSYLRKVLNYDINKDGVKRDINKIKLFLKSLSRNESKIISNSSIARDINISRNTVADYFEVLVKLNLIENQNAYVTNLRSRDVVCKSPKRHLVDPSLACASLNISPDKLINDIKCFGFMFEALVERDLRIYIESLGGKLYHYRNNKTGAEVDAIVELPTGEIGAIEIKLGSNQIDEVKLSLNKFLDEVSITLTFRCIICGLYTSVIKDPESGIYILPITALKP